MNADTDDAPGAGVEAETVENLLPVLIGRGVEENFAGPGGNEFWILSNGLNVNDECCWLPHVLKLTCAEDNSGATSSTGLEHVPQRELNAAGAATEHLVPLRKIRIAWDEEAAGRCVGVLQ